MKWTAIFTISVLIVIISFGTWFIWSDETTKTDATQPDFIYIDKQLGSNFNVFIYEDTKTGVQYIIYDHHGTYGCTMSPRYNPDGSLFQSTTPEAT